MRRVIVFVAAITAMALMAVPAMGQDYPPDPAAGSVSVSDATVVPGQTITVSGSGWLPGSEVTIDLLCDGDEWTYGSTPVADDGTFSEDITIPEDAQPGDCILRISGTNITGEEQVVDVALTIVAPDEPRPDPDLAVTGADSMVAGLVGIGLLGVGGSALYVARRRQAAQRA